MAASGVVLERHRAGVAQLRGADDRLAAPTPYGARITAIVVYLLHGQFLPEKRLAQLMADLSSVSLTTAAIASVSRICAERFAGAAAVLRDHVIAAVKHLDETGFRIGGKTQWLHATSALLLTFYRTSPGRGSLPDTMAGIVLHDHWKPVLYA